MAAETDPEELGLDPELAEELGDEVDPNPVPRRPSKRALAAAKLKISGASDAEIADMMDYVTPAAARMAWESAIAATVDPSVDFQTLRQLRAAQLEAGMRALAPRALSATVLEEVDDGHGGKKKVRRRNEEHYVASQMYLRYLDRLIKLQGLDAPQVTMLVTPGVQEFENIVQGITSQLRGIQAAEADIFEESDDGSFVQTNAAADT